jgi:hypothetical protein
MVQTPKKNMGRSPTVRLRFSPLINPNPGMERRGRSAEPMRIDKGGMPFPGMQPFSGMLEKNNIAMTDIALE